AEILCGTVSRRRRGMSAVAMSLVALQSSIPISMFDCPEHSQTSPISTSLAVVDWPSELATVNVRGSLDAAIGLSVVRQFPLASAITTRLWSPKVSVIFAAGFVQPQTGTATSRCSTAWSQNSGFNNGRSGAFAGAARSVMQANIAKDQTTIGWKRF